MRTKGQLIRFLCRCLELEDEATIEIQILNSELGHTPLRSTIELSTGAVEGIWLVRQGQAVGGISSPTVDTNTRVVTRKITEFLFGSEALGICVTSDSQSMPIGASKSSCLYISGVKPGGQGERLGIRQGDVVIGVNGVPIDECLGSTSQSATAVVDMFSAHISSLPRPLTLNMLAANETQDDRHGVERRYQGTESYPRLAQQTPMMQQMMMQHAEDQRQMLQRMEIMQAQISDMKTTPQANSPTVKNKHVERMRMLQAERARRESSANGATISSSLSSSSEMVHVVGGQTENFSVLEELQAEIEQLRAANLTLQRSDLAHQARAGVCSPETKWWC
jgi:hypothetical protein